MSLETSRLIVLHNYGETGCGENGCASSGVATAGGAIDGRAGTGGHYQIGLGRRLATG